MKYPTHQHPSRERGLSMIELLVSLVIGVVLVLGATQLYVDSRNSYGVNEAVARLQETARYALSVVEPDVRMANSFGLIKGASLITGQAAQTVAAAAVAPAAANVCGTNFAVDLNTTVQADNNGYVLSASRGAGCNTLSGWTTTPVTSADTLTIRRASTANTVSTASRLQICSTRTTARLYSDGSACAATPAGQVNDLVVHAYYVDRNSEQQVGMPSLRRKSLVSTGGAIQFIDQEVMAGVEDLQVQFGVEAGTTGIATRYVNPNALPAVLAAGGQVVAVRLWLLVRADAPEGGFVDGRIYEYGDRAQGNGITSNLNAASAATRAFQPSQSADNSFTSIKRYRRLLVSRTIQLRNALGT
jgi:type IV pilus assembly protein PilW